MTCEESVMVPDVCGASPETVLSGEDVAVLDAVRGVVV